MVPVPTLRQDLQLLKSWATRNGEPTWTIFDPLRNQYFRIGRTFFIFLSLWRLSTIDAIKQEAQARLKREIDTDEVGEFVKFLLANQLTDVSPENGYRDYFQKAEAGRKGWFATALHSYLFFKIPIFRPDRFLAFAWPFARFLFTRAIVVVLVLIGLSGLYLVSRQWTAFKDNFLALLSMEGAVLYGASLILIKVFHELGHAFMAHKYGLKVSVIGVAFLVLMPIMYTDTSNAWRLRAKRQRLMVDGAGIMVELGMACIATFAWVFVPEGGMRSALFSVAAVSWTLSLLVNLNPFMRFDGYFILSDALEVENLQARGFALARWRMREAFFGLGMPPPENVDPRVRRTLILHAWGTWIYRFFLFVGIAVLVYAFFIKVVAIFLFIVEILWFIALPIYREMKEWWAMRAQIVQTRRSAVSGAVLLAALLGLFLPLSNTVSVIGIVHAQQEVNVYAPYPSRLVELHVATTMAVKKGDVLAVFQSEDLNLKIDLLEKKRALLQRRIDRSGSDAIDGADRLVLESEMAGRDEELRNLLMQRDELVLRASQDGVVADLSAQIHTGRFVDQSSALFRLRSPGTVGVTGLVNEMHLDRITVGAKATFYPDNMELASLPVALTKINNSSSRTLSFPAMSNTFGGSVPTQMADGSKAGLDVEGSYYGLEFLAGEQPARDYGQTQRGILHLDAKAKSIARRIFERVGTVLIRESGF